MAEDDLLLARESSILRLLKAGPLPRVTLKNPWWIFGRWRWCCWLCWLKTMVMLLLSMLVMLTKILMSILAFSLYSVLQLWPLFLCPTLIIRLKLTMIYNHNSPKQKKSFPSHAIHKMEHVCCSCCCSQLVSWFHPSNQAGSKHFRSYAFRSAFFAHCLDTNVYLAVQWLVRFGPSSLLQRSNTCTVILELRNILILVTQKTKTHFCCWQIWEICCNVCSWTWEGCGLAAWG